jgi:Zn finger protein HypA/HybF involved in hydrogenase expression
LTRSLIRDIRLRGKRRYTEVVQGGVFQKAVDRTSCRPAGVAARAKYSESDQEEDMHELGITQGVIDRAREAAEREGAARIGVLYLTITPAADFTRESIEMYFEMLAGEDPLFAGAVFRWEEAPAEAHCLSCSGEFPATVSRPVCPHCGSLQVAFDPRGALLQLTGIGIDDEAD